MSGDHSRKIVEKLVGKKTLRELIKDPLSHGAEYAHDFGSYPAKKTIFCPTWSDKKIMDEIKSAINNIIYINQDILKNKNGLVGIIGISKNNFKIEMLFKALPSKIKITTAYPYDPLRSKFKN
ncbi:EndoU domain-containing protein [Candidatus Dependentiae bacterium]|nr:EndoU domain-containing protein [Candidatus Dependentiae bacterium]